MKLRLWKPDVVSRERPFARTDTHRYSNEKIFFQSFFMLMTVQFFFLASA